MQIFPTTDKLLLSMIDQIMVYSPKDRLKAVEALSHPYFDELRDQATYTHIQAQYNLKDFFSFSEEELVGNKHLRSRLIPPWYVSH
jgi:glycogen synthase kinase 3 beta